MGVRRRRRRLILILATVGAAAAGALRFIRLEIVGDSMLPSLRAGERVLAVRGVPVHAGALVAVPDPRQPARLLVKRVEGIIGEDVYLAGDNPDASTDSRAFGPVARAAIAGRVVYRYWPAERAGSLLR